MAEWTERTAVESRLEEARTRVIGLTSRTATTSDGVAGEAGHGRAGTASALGARRMRRHAIDVSVSTIYQQRSPASRREEREAGKAGTYTAGK